MKTTMKIFWLFTLMFFAAGCSGYRVICDVSPEGGELTDLDIVEACHIEPGDEVRLNLVGGEQVEGMVEFISQYEIILDHDGQSFQPRGFPTDQIRSIELSYTKSTKTGILVLAGSLAVAGAVAAAITLSNMDFYGE